MNDSIELAKQLKSEIEKEPLIIEYRRVKALMESNDEISALKRDIALAKAHHNDELHKRLLNKYNSHPLVNNYEVLKEEVNDYLNQISKIINKK